MISSLEFECERRLHVKMEKLTLVKKNDRCFTNPFLAAQQPASIESYKVDEALKEKIKVYALHLMSFWEKDIKEEIEYTGKWRDCSVYTGIAGYALLYLEAGKILNNTDYIEQAFFLSEKCSMHLDGQTMTYLIGDAGPLALSAVCSNLMNQPEKEQHFIKRLEKMYHHSTEFTDPSSTMPDELLYGRAGFLYALLFVKQYNPGKIDDQMIIEIASTIVESGKRLAKQLKQKGIQTPPLMYQWHEKKYLGAAHGMAGIIYLLLQVKDFLGVGVLENYVRPSLDFLLDTRFPSGNFPSSLESDQDRLVQWCHGSPGFIHCLVTAAQVFKSEHYLDVAKQSAEVCWERGILTKGFNLCHGIAGNALAILHLYQYTKDPLYLYRACKFADIIIDGKPHEFRTPDRPLSLFEGTAGVIHFLFDLLQPEKSHFPGYQLDLSSSSK